MREHRGGFVQRRRHPREPADLTSPANPAQSRRSLSFPGGTSVFILLLTKHLSFTAPGRRRKVSAPTRRCRCRGRYSCKNGDDQAGSAGAPQSRSRGPTYTGSREVGSSEQMSSSRVFVQNSRRTSAAVMHNATNSGIRTNAGRVLHADARGVPRSFWMTTVRVGTSAARLCSGLAVRRVRVLERARHVRAALDFDQERDEGGRNDDAAERRKAVRQVAREAKEEKHAPRHSTDVAPRTNDRADSAQGGGLDVRHDAK
mmetsp:Transcript_23193/g.72643  ORF Transcript_23193/g.72643 Transcript_23193/m.72643 type:complete len:258 (-) Transcript_23193:1321-2094(-)